MLFSVFYTILCIYEFFFHTHLVYVFLSSIQTCHYEIRRCAIIAHLGQSLFSRGARFSKLRNMRSNPGISKSYPMYRGKEGSTEIIKRNGWRKGQHRERDTLQRFLRPIDSFAYKRTDGHNSRQFWWILCTTTLFVSPRT
jgi:hypothetical protein